MDQIQEKDSGGILGPNLAHLLLHTGGAQAPWGLHFSKQKKSTCLTSASEYAQKHHSLDKADSSAPFSHQGLTGNQKLGIPCLIARYGRQSQHAPNGSGPSHVQMRHCFPLENN